MPEYRLLPLLATVGLASGVWGLMNRFGDRTDRHYALPAAGAILIIGLEWAYELPTYAYLLGLLVAPFLFHRTVRGRLERACRGLPDLPVEDLGISLVRVPDLSGRHVAVWQAKEAAQKEGGRSPIVAGAPEDAADRTLVGPQTLVLALDLLQDAEDEYRIVLRGEAPRPCAELVVHHEEAVTPRITQVLEGAERLDHFREMESWMSIRAGMHDFAFQALDIRAFALLHDLFQLRREEREIYVHTHGKDIRVGVTSAFQAHELPAFVTVGARLIQCLREAAVRFGRQNR